MERDNKVSIICFMWVTKLRVCPHPKTARRAHRRILLFNELSNFQTNSDLPRDTLPPLVCDLRPAT